MTNGVMVYPHISTKNSKLGMSIPTINLPTGITCREDSPCFKQCYANKGNMARKSVRTCAEKNLDAYKSNPEGYFKVIDITLEMIPFRYFRYHSSGDIPDERYLELMCRLARKHKQTKFLCFTKKYEIVNEYLNAHKKPSNLVLVLSNWGGWICPNPHNLPTAWIELKNQACMIPNNANKCNDYCGDCCNSGKSCWKLKKGDSVVFKQH